ncbi:MAG TPA: hypothetical protein VH088_07230, partial [Terriglobales bacterium]|nr:hypothetical protein [Terriglobales bacterium]
AGRIAVSLAVLSSDGRVVARLDKNRFVVNASNYLEKRQTDLSRMVVVDQFDTEVLDIWYLNPRAIKVNAHLWYPETGTILITDKSLIFQHGSSISTMCVSPGAAKGSDILVP